MIYKVKEFIIVFLVVLLFVIVLTIFDDSKVKNFDELCRKSCGDLYATECNFKDINSAQFVLVSWCENLTDGKVTNHTYVRAELLDFR